MSDWHRKKLFLDYRNIILCHLGGQRVSSAWDNFLNETQNDEKTGFKQVTPWGAYWALLLCELLFPCIILWGAYSVQSA
jgi:hypothetical protein